jgi:hypothetical protein
MPTAELLTAWKPRLRADGLIDVGHSCDLVEALTAQIEAMGVERSVAQLAAGSVVNCQCYPDFGLNGTQHADPFRATAALRAIRAWVAASDAQRKAA